LSSAQWLHNEIPVRVARQVTKIDKLPYGLCLMDSVRKVRHWYKDSFSKLTSFPYPKNIDQAEEYTRLLEELFDRHDGTLMTMAKGVHELKAELKTDGHDISNYIDLTEHLNSLYTSRIGIRLLVGHHLEITKEQKKKILRVWYFGRHLLSKLYTVLPMMLSTFVLPHMVSVQW